MQLEIITPDTTIFAGEVNSVQLPGKDGLFQLLNNHAPIISSLAEGRVKIEDANNETHLFDIKGGVIEMLNNKVIVLAD